LHLSIVSVYSSLKNLTLLLFCLIANSVVVLFLYGGLLLIFWLLSMYSVSIYESFDITTKSALLEISNYYYFNDHLKKLAVGLVLCVVAWFTPLDRIKKSKYVIFGWSVILVLLLFTPLADQALEKAKWANLWLDIPWWTIQPWEFFKLWYMFFLSSWLVRKKKIMDDWTYFFWFGIVVALCCSVFLLLPDFWSLMVLWPVSLVVFWYAWWRPFYIVVTLILWVMAVLWASLQFNYVQERLDYFFSSDPQLQNQWVGYQSHQALIAVWWWWLIGKGYGKGLQKFWYIPEAQSDFIFAAFSEEVGFLWWLVLLTLYFMLAWTVVTRLKNIQDSYERTLAVGILSLILLQAFVNIAVNIKVLPLTWVTLPFLSHGWSALVVTMIEIVLLVKILEQK
jgi:cell division protein FtsW